MKKLIVLLSAVALIGLTSCSQEQLGPKNEGAKKEVKTNFSFSIASKTQAQTKATSNEVQIDGKFRGMQDMTLFVANQELAVPSSNGDFMPDYVYDLGTLSADEITAAESSKIYNLSIPIGVNNMTFYGLATKGTDDDGDLKWNIGTTKGTTSFESVPIADDLTDFDATATALAAILNDVISAEATIDGSVVTWASLATTTDAMLFGLRDAYKELTTIQTGEFRDGSGFGVQRMMSDLYKIVASKTDEISKAIKAKIETYFTADTEGNLTYKTAEYLDFPSSLDLPNGAAQLTFASGAFKYATGPEAMGGSSAAVASVSDFVKPAALAYWANSPIRVSSSENITEADYPKPVRDWRNDSKWNAKWPADGKFGTVASDTRAVALQNSIQYGVAMLKTTVKYSGTTVADNRKAIAERKAKELDPSSTYTEEDKLITVDGNSFQVKGILVGGQPTKVGWDWVSTTDDFSKVIYDNVFDGYAIPASGASDPFYTLVFDNYCPTRHPVNVALELVNNTGEDFYGRDNVIPAGGTFYLVGQITLEALMNNGNKSIISLCTSLIDAKLTKESLPPYFADESTIEQLWDRFARVFIQDHLTTMNFSITNLHGAYATVPDLRSVEMTFGLSVDLSWESGVTFGIELK